MLADAGPTSVEVKHGDGDILNNYYRRHQVWGRRSSAHVTVQADESDATFRS